MKAQTGLAHPRDLARKIFPQRRPECPHGVLWPEKWTYRDFLLPKTRQPQKPGVERQVQVAFEFRRKFSRETWRTVDSTVDLYTIRGDLKMRTLVIANQKGGVGKTSICVHLAYHFADIGVRVCVIDLDHQANASRTLRDNATLVHASQLFTDGGVERSAFEVERNLLVVTGDPGLVRLDQMSLQEAGQRFRSALGTIADAGVEVCIVDTAPSLSVSMAAALLGADFVLSPIELELYSILGIEKMVTTVRNLQQANPGLKFLGMVPSKVDTRKARQKSHLQDLQNAYKKLVLPSVALRDSVAEALAESVPVWDMKKRAAKEAAKELRFLGGLVAKEMGVGAA